MATSESYTLPVKKVENMRRNIPPVSIKTYYSLEDLRKGDTSGTTDTDTKTDKGTDSGLTSINKKHG